MSLRLTIRNRQRTRAVDLRLLRKIISALFGELPQLQSADLGLSLVAAPEMARVNETYLRHSGSTDVITFSYTDATPGIPHPASRIHGDLFICLDDALLQARQFRTTWQSELVRYVVHGVLHLLGHDDLQPAARRKMKREENRLVKLLTARFPLSRLARGPKLRS